MSVRKLGYALVVFGVILILASLIVDLVGLGDDRIGSSQLLGIMCGILVTLFGLPLASRSPEEKIGLPNLVRGCPARLFDLPVIFWVAVGLLVGYILFFVSPMFLNDNWGIFYFTKYLPDARPIGLDLRTTMNVVTPWVEEGQSPYPHLFYPPLTYILFAPLALLDYPDSYVLITFLTLFSFCAMAVLGAFLLSPNRDRSFIVLFLATGLISYGFQFELERGQFNVIVFFLCMLALYIFYRHYEFRYLAYALFSAAVHVKLYPAIFILMFVRDWRDWKANIRRLVGLGALNFFLLFALGYRELVGFVNTVMVQILTPSWTWNGNHSVQTFVLNFSRDGYGLIPPDMLAALQRNAGSITNILLVVILGCILAAVVRAYLLNERGFNPYLFSVCTLGALIIPTSNDYTLPILAIPLAMFFSSLPPIRVLRKKTWSILLILAASVAYGSILHPFKYKPYYMNNTFPPLLLILITVTLLYFMRTPPKTLASQAELQT